MIRYIPGTNPLDAELYRYTEAERDDLLTRLRAATTPRRVAAARATAARWEQYRASQPPPERPTSASLVSQHMHVTNPGRVAARYAMLTGVTLAAAVWHLRDLGVVVSARTASKRWREIYPGVAAGLRRRSALPRGSVPSAPGHAVTIEEYVSQSWVEEDDTPARVARWSCSCGRRGQEHHHSVAPRCIGTAVRHVRGALKRAGDVVVPAVPAAARRPARSRPAPAADPPIPFWLLPTGPIRK